MHITKYFPKKVRKKPIFYVVYGQFAKNYGTVLKKCVSPYFSYLCIWKY